MSASQSRIVRFYTQAGKVRRVKGEFSVGQNTIQLAFTEDSLVFPSDTHTLKLSVYCLWVKFKSKQKCERNYRKLWEEATTLNLSKALLIAMFSIWRHDRQIAVKAHLNLRGFKGALSILQKNTLKEL